MAIHVYMYHTCQQEIRFSEKGSEARTVGYLLKVFSKALDEKERTSKIPGNTGNGLATIVSEGIYFGVHRNRDLTGSDPRYAKIENISELFKRHIHGKSDISDEIRTLSEELRTMPEVVVHMYDSAPRLIQRARA